MPLIRVDQLSHLYPAAPEPIAALRDVTLDLDAGEYLSIVGANGSGKSTLARHLNALLLPTEGEVWVAGLNTRDPANLRGIRSRVAMVFQNPENQFVATVADEDVAFGPENFGVPPAELVARVDAALAAVGLAPFRTRAPHELSAGQQQRLAIAGALAIQPATLVLDEATSMLDPRGKQGVMELAAQLHGRGLALAAITQSMEEAAQAARIIVMDRGRIAAAGAPRDVFADAAGLVQLGLDLPPATAIAHALAETLPGYDANLIGMEELGDAVYAAWEATGRPANRPEGATDAVSAPTARGEPVIQVRGLEHTFLRGTPRAHQALFGVDLDVYAGEIVGIVGETGSGKSTLLQHLNGLIRPAPGDGRVVVDGVDLSDPRADVRALRRRVGLVFQYSERQLFERYVGDDVAFGPRQYGLGKDEVRERVKQALERVGLDFLEFKDRRTLTLSGGQRRRVALAGVLALEPRVLVLDEPTAGLDPRGRDEFLRSLRKWRDQGVTVVLVSHNMDEVARVCDRVYVLGHGRVIATGSPRDLFAGGLDLDALGLAPPPAVRLMRSLKMRGMPVSGRALTVQEAAAELAALLSGRDA